MASKVQTEAFPPVSPSSTPRGPMRRLSSARTPGTRRRKSSSLGGDPRGDTGAGAIATNLAQSGSDSPATPTDQRQRHREHKRTPARKLLRRCKRTALRHTWVIPLALLVVLVAAYFVSPGEHNPLHPALFLSYPNPPLNERTATLPAHIGDVIQYGKGRKDFAFVAFYTVVFTFTREFLMQCLIKPIAIWCGFTKRGKQARFMEQFYTAIYFAIFGPFGLFVMSRTPVWFFNTAGMYEGFPHRAHEAYFKAYYLLQASYWAQQAIVLMLQLEKPRKDFKELVLHHIITLSLIGLSYRFHFTYMGIAVYITHDISDFFLATSKLLNYVDSSLTPFYFVSFMGIWAYLRHYLNLCILGSLLPPAHITIPFTQTTFETGSFTTVGDYTLNWETQQYKCWISQVITFGLLAALQAVNIFWFVLILRILVRFVLKGVQKDERSEDEDEEDEPVDADKRANGYAVVANGHAAANGYAVKPKVAANGRPLGSTEGPAAGTRSRNGANVVKRKGNGRR